MARIAQIRTATNRVANVIEAPADWTFPPGFSAYALGINQPCGPGWLFNGVDSFTPPDAIIPTDAEELTAAVVAIALLTLDEINRLRGWVAAFKGEVAAASSLGDLKTRVSSLPNMPDRTRQQLMQAVKAKLAEA